MKIAFKTSVPLRHFILAGLLATSGASVMAQGTPGAPASGPAMSAPSGDHSGHHMNRHDPEKMQAWMAKRQAEMKTTLKITPAQEGAWTAYTTALQSTMPMMGQTSDQRAELDKLTTPQRIDKMRALRTQHMTEMAAAHDKRDEATKTFYAALTPEQQALFDAEHKKHSMQGKRGGQPMK